MKVRLHVLVIAASKVCPKIDRNQFVGAIKSYIGRCADKETVSSQAKQSKENGDYFVASLNQKTDKQYGIDAKAIHWLALNAEILELGLSEGVVQPSTEIAEWLAKFVPTAVPTPAPIPAAK